MTAAGPAGMETRPVTGRVLRCRRGGLSLRVAPRSIAVGVALVIALLAVSAITLATGEFRLPLGEVLRALAGQGSGAAEFIVTTLRAPRLLTALLVGAALAVSGAVLQSLSGNSLGSPDFIGITGGSATGALLVIVVIHGGMLQIAAGALLGGLATAVVIYLLAFSRGVTGSRFVLVGIGVSAMLLAANSYLISRAGLTDALAAQAWLIGSLNGRGWEQVVPIAGAVVILLPLGLCHARGLAMLEMGDDAAKALGVGVERARFVLLLVSVGLAALATAVAGPIAFVAMAAPRIARQLTSSAGPCLVPAALTGALLLSVGDLAVQRVFSPAQLPVGIATGALGGLYLIWLLASQWRRGRP